MTAKTATRKATLAEGALFVIFSIASGCACCSTGPRETVVPAAPGRTRDALRDLLAYPHGVHFTTITLHVVEADVELSRERVDALRASVAR